jgi:hypothetical protein
LRFAGFLAGRLTGRGLGTGLRFFGSAGFFLIGATGRFFLFCIGSFFTILFFTKLFCLDLDFFFVDKAGPLDKWRSVP